MEHQAQQQHMQQQQQKRSTPIQLQQRSFFSLIRQAPLLFIGAITTVGVLGYGMFSMFRGDPVKAGKGMGMRVTTQTLTVGLIVGFLTYSGNGPISSLNQKVREWRGLPPIKEDKTKSNSSLQNSSTSNI